MNERPLGVAIEDFRTNLGNLINECGLPAYIVEMAICAVLPEISSIGKQQMEQERQKFQQEVSENDNE